MNFQELIRNRIETSLEDQTWVDEICIDESSIYEQGALMARDAIIELLEKVNDGNFDEITGEPLHENSHWEIETIRNLIRLIKESKDYE